MWIAVRGMAAVWLLWAACIAAAATSPIVVSEVMYAPLPDPAGIEATADFEFLELQNVSAAAFDLTGAYLTNAVEFVFPAGTVIPAGGFLVVPAKRSTFQGRYGETVPTTSGYARKLSDEGDTVELRAADGSALVRFTYDNSGEWPARADGFGSSLELVDPLADANDPANWRASTEYQGSPGRAGVGPVRRVLINELLAHTDPPFEDAVELYNPGDAPVAIGGWYLSNSLANPLKFRIPDGTLVPARGYVVFYELARTGAAAGFNPDGTGDSPSFTFNSAHGDDATLLSTDDAGRPLRWEDAVTFGPTANGKPLGRYPDGADRFVPLSRQTFGTLVEASFPETFLAVFRTGTGAANAYPEVGPIILSRIMYHPPDGGDEYVEIQNVADTPTPLFDPANPANTWRLGNAIHFGFPTGITLAAGERALVVPLPPEDFRAKHGLPAALRIFGPYTNALNNAGGTLELLYPDPPQQPPHPDAGLVPYVLLEAVPYRPVAPWPVAADGLGAALQRRAVHLRADDAASWEASGPEPSAPQLSASLAGSTLTLSFVAETGRTYRLHRNVGLEPAGWATGEVLTTPPAGGAASVSLPLTADARPEFFRVTAE